MARGFAFKKANTSLGQKKRALSIAIEEEELSPEILRERNLLANENSIYLQSIYESVQMGYRTQMVGRSRRALKHDHTVSPLPSRCAAFHSPTVVH